MIVIVCGKCGGRFDVSDHAGGGRAICSHCGALIPVAPVSSSYYPPRRKSDSNVCGTIAMVCAFIALAATRGRYSRHVDIHGFSGDTDIDSRGSTGNCRFILAQKIAGGFWDNNVWFAPVVRGIYYLGRIRHPLIVASGGRFLFLFRLFYSPRFAPRQPCTIGRRRPGPKDLLVTLRHGAACLRLYSLRSTARSTRTTVAAS